MNLEAHNNAKKWNAAAEKLLAAVPSPTAQQVLRETALQLGIPLWMLITGLLQKCYDTGEHTSPVLDPSWTFGNPTERPTLGESVCKHCQTAYTPRWIGQEYCCDKCGSAAANLARERALAEPKLVRYSVGSEPPEVAKSTITEAEAHGPRVPGPGFIEVGTETPQLGGEPLGETGDPIATIERQAQAAAGLTS